MPLEAGKSREIFGHNVAELIRAGLPGAQALAAAYQKSGLDCAEDMTPRDWHQLLHGIVKWISEEETEGEHKDAADEKERSARSWEQFANKFYADDRHGAQDSLNIAFDEASVRTYDKDGHLHIARTPITRAVVSDYMGSEIKNIPGAAALNPQPNRRYRLYRDLEELEKSADSFVGKPIMIVHKATSANAHPREVTVGAIGSPIEIEGDTVYAPLIIWDGEAIGVIEDGSQVGLSCGYRYEIDPTPGNAPDGSAYDGRMIKIFGNHLALVSEPRVQGAMVADGKYEFMWALIESAILSLPA